MNDGETDAIAQAYHAVIQNIYTVLYNELIHCTVDQVEPAVDRARKGLKKAEQTREIMERLVNGH